MKSTSFRKKAQFEPIGVVKNSVRSKMEAGWGRVVSRIVLKKKFSRGLSGLEKFSHAVVIFWLHRTYEEKEPVQILRHPRNRSDLPLLGIFAQRARRRPNPLAVTVVRLERQRGSTLWVRGLDAMDGTPVLDIKPYFPMFDRPDKFRVPAWVGRAMQGYF